MQEFFQHEVASSGEWKALHVVAANECIKRGHQPRPYNICARPEIMPRVPRYWSIGEGVRSYASGRRRRRSTAAATHQPSLHCSRRPFIQHRTAVEHRCDHRGGQHRCRPLGATTIRRVHFILSGGYKRGVLK
jgi:hypothetical protein